MKKEFEKGGPVNAIKAVERKYFKYLQPVLKLLYDNMIIPAILLNEEKVDKTFEMFLIWSDIGTVRIIQKKLKKGTKYLIKNSHPKKKASMSEIDPAAAVFILRYQKFLRDDKTMRNIYNALQAIKSSTPQPANKHNPAGKKLLMLFEKREALQAKKLSAAKKGNVALIANLHDLEFALSKQIAEALKKRYPNEKLFRSKLLTKVIIDGSSYF